MNRMDVQSIICENERRGAELSAPYNAISGIGCYGEREYVYVSDAPQKELWLPIGMMNEPSVIALKKYGSIEEVLCSNGFEASDDTYTAFWIDFCELRYKYDFEWFAVSCITIRHKITGKDIPFVLNRGQRLVLERLERMRLEGRPIRLMLLKSRQWGGSTLVQLYMSWIQLIHKRNWNSVICAHIKDASKNIRAMLERSVKNMIPIGWVKVNIRPYQQTQNIKEIVERGCLITVGTAVEPDSVRSQDAKMAHFSEIAFFPNTDNNNPESLEASIVSSIPVEPYTMVVRESTANGVGDHFHREWEKAKNGETLYDALFVQWYTIDMYSKSFDGGYYLGNGKWTDGSIDDFVASLTDYEYNLFVNHKGCLLENINWRRLMRGQMVSEAKMRQEYPSDDIEAFQDSGSPVFRAEEVEALRGGCHEPVAVGRLRGDMQANEAKMHPKRRAEILDGLTFVEEDVARLKGSANIYRDRLKVWAFPDTEINVSNRYVVVFDPQKGLSEKADWGVIVVIDRYWMMFGGKPEVVAEWRGRLDKDITIWIATQVAKWYCNALLVIESNTYESDGRYDDSEFIFDTISHYYKNIYSRTPSDKVKEGEPVEYGWHTNRSTKPMIVENFISELRESGYVERSGIACDELRTYEQKKNGSYGAKAGCHDDVAMTRMIGLYVCRNLRLPVVVEDKPARKPVVRNGSFASF